MKLRNLFVFLGLAVLVVLTVFNWGQIKEAVGLIRQATWPLLLFIPIIQLMSFYANARYYQTFFEGFGIHTKLPKLYKLSLALNFVNQVFPSAGFSAITFFSYSLREVPAGKVTLAQYGRYILTFLSFLILMAMGFLLIFFGGGIDRIVVRLMLILIGTSFLTIVGIVSLLSNQQRFDRVALWLQRKIDRITRRLRRDPAKPLLGSKRVKRVLREFHHGYRQLMAERKHLRLPFLYALLGNVFEVLTLYLVFLALGVLINPGAVIIAYAVANATAIVSLVPGDVGVYELTMVAVLSTTGTPVAVGLSATLLYRILNKALFLPPGFYYYSQYLRKLKGDEDAKPNSAG